MKPLHRCLAAVLSFILLAAVAPSNTYKPYEAPQRMVDLGTGRRLNIYCSGIGSPTVILDGAIGSSMFVWHLVQPKLAQHLRVCSYDRAGYGFSDPGGLPHTTNANVDDLHALLVHAHIRPPYVLVAHSLNAFDARVFADRYRSEVAAMLLIDPSEVEETRFGSIYGKKKLDASQASDTAFLKACDKKAHKNLLKPGDDCVGPSDPHEPLLFGHVQQMHNQSAGFWDAILSEETHLPSDLAEVKGEQRAYGNLPLMILSSGSAEDAEKQQGATDAQIAAANRLWKQLHDNDAALSEFGVNCLIPNVGHYIQLEKPQLVVKAVLTLTQAIRNVHKPSCTI